MTLDHYAGAARRWAEGASLVYGPIARQLIDSSRRRLDGRVVLDVGAGTGVANAALNQAGARTVAADRSLDMLAWQVDMRPPAMVADIRALPLLDQAVDDVVAAFVLNHLTEPVAAMTELQRVVRPGGTLLACVYANDNRSDVRDAIDRTAEREGWEIPEWYRDIKLKAAPVLGTAENMEQCAHRAGLIDISVVERPVDVGVTEPEQLVAYRLGQAHYSSWLAQLAPRRRERVQARLVEEIRPIMQPYKPVVVFLAATIS